jgi:RimJ/RimL family protein N-acetyltransferase
VKEDASEQTGLDPEPRWRVEAITLETISRLRLGWSSRFDREDVGRLVFENPGLSRWIPDTGEYVVGGPWRHRHEIASVMELVAPNGAVALLRAIRSASGEAGKRLIIASEHHESRQNASYLAAGYELVEEIVIYELMNAAGAGREQWSLRFEEVNLRDPIEFRELLELDHKSFPWLWWNSREEFVNYAESFGVNIYLGRDRERRPVSYIGVTRFRNWGHLDRIAVDPTRQGQGYGLESLDWAVQSLTRSGARRIGLSTQARNLRSRKLYERYGFQRVPAQDYALFGQWLGPMEPMS